MIEALRLTSDANRLSRTPILQGHKFIRKIMEQLRVQVILLIEIRLKGHSGV